MLRFLNNPLSLPRFCAVFSHSCVWLRSVQKIIVVLCTGMAMSAIAELSEAAPNETKEFVYEARMGPITAGELDFGFERSDDKYRLLGRFFSSKSLSKHYTWTGTFASYGQWREEGPVTRSYFVQSESTDDDYKVVLMSPEGTQLLNGRDGEFESLPKPAGIDLISALMFTPGCFAGPAVHDGEDAYPIRLIKAEASELPRRRGFFSGPVTRCEYVVTTRRGKERRLRVSLAQIDGVWVATEVRVRIAIFPDPVFRLRV